jgi:5-methylcytosine-specific restriction endonuclease McrA
MTTDAFYNSREWRALRARHIKANPYCRVCLMLGYMERGQHVDHIHEIKGGGAPLDPRNLQTLCKLHHDQKTSAATFTVTGLDGYDRPEVLSVGAKRDRGSNKL